MKMSLKKWEELVEETFLRKDDKFISGRIRKARGKQKEQLKQKSDVQKKVETKGI